MVFLVSQFLFVLFGLFGLIVLCPVPFRWRAGDRVERGARRGQRDRPQNRARTLRGRRASRAA